MSALVERLDTHPAGESVSEPSLPSGAWPVDTPGGRFYAEWDPEAPVTREAPLLFFCQFLEAGGRWEQFMERCPLRYSGNRGSGAREVMGTVLLSALNGHWRYAHINSVHGDGITPGLLGMERTVSEERGRSAGGHETHRRIHWPSLVARRVA